MHGISRRWMVNTIGVVFLILTAFITILSLMVRSSTYNGIELALAGRADELLNWLSAGSATSSSFTGIVRDYIETFPDKNNTRTRKCPITKRPYKARGIPANGWEN